MYHLDNASSVPDMPAIKPVLFTERRWFTEGGDGIQPSYPGADWFNAIQAEMLNVLALANITPDKTHWTSLPRPSVFSPRTICCRRVFRLRGRGRQRRPALC
jgi:hypothetical protein